MNSMIKVFLFFCMLFSYSSTALAEKWNYDSLMHQPFLNVYLCNINSGLVHKGYPAIAKVVIRNTLPPESYPETFYDNMRKTNYKQWQSLPAKEREFVSFVDRVSLSAYPKTHLFDYLPPPLAIRISFAKGNSIREWPVTECSYRYYSEIQKNPDSYEYTPGVSLKPGESNVIYMDINRCCVALAPGEYSLSVSVQGQKSQTTGLESQSCKFKIVQADSSMNSFFSNHFKHIFEKNTDLYFYSNNICEADGFARALIRAPKIDINEMQKQIKSEYFEIIAPYLFLNNIFNEETPCTNEYKILENFPPFLAPLAECYKYDCLVKIGKSQLVSTKRAEIEQKYPEMRWMIEEADKGNGALKYLLEMKDVKKIKCISERSIVKDYYSNK
jgi:hypothetical protein